MMRSSPTGSARGIEPGLRELVGLRTAQMNGNATCIDMHTISARKAEVPDEKIVALAGWRDLPSYTARERAALAWTEAVTRPNGRAFEETWPLVRAVFDEKELCWLSLTIALSNVWNRMNGVTGGWPLVR
jgi:AhpD family alkylhydroperoxidase